MVFSSAIFLFIFLPLTLFIYHLISPRYKNCFLLLASLFFYAWGEPVNVFLMLLSICFNFLCAQIIEKTRERKLCPNFFLIISIIFNLGLLFYFKYLDFSINNINHLFKLNLPLKNIALPIGISFFTFQILSYVIDVKRGIVSAQKNIINLGLYISFFPQLIAGPIVRYVDVNEQIQNRSIDLTKFSDGCMRFMKGFSKKILIADQLSPYVDKIFEQHGISAPAAWFGIIAYTLQIYFDFSGYSDMAIGLGKMFGFTFLENFNYPYISKSVKEFWRRWHMSLSQWFRDYVYIPLGGNRKGKIRNILNLLIVWALTGFWHGSSWNFIIWGLYYFAFLQLERYFLGKHLNVIPSAFQHLYTILIIIVGWIFFREESLTSSIIYIKNLFLINKTSWIDFIYLIDRKFIFCIIMGIIFSTPVIPYIKTKLNGKMEIIRFAVLILIFIIAIAFLLGEGFSPFLYFRF